MPDHSHNHPHGHEPALPILFLTFGHEPLERLLATRPDLAPQKKRIS